VLEFLPDLVVGMLNTQSNWRVWINQQHLISNNKDRQDMEANNSKGRLLHQITEVVHQHLVLPAVEGTDRLSLAHQFKLLPAVGATVDQAKDRQDVDNRPQGHPFLPAVVAMDQPHHLQLHHPEVVATAADLSSNLFHRRRRRVCHVSYKNLPSTLNFCLR
jgi:hypothetical protein